MSIVVPEWDNVLQMLIPMCTVICLAGSVLLFLYAKGSRSKRFLASVMLAWGMIYAVRILGILFGFMSFMDSDLLAPFVLITGNFYAIVLLLYPIEVVRPGWLNLKRSLLITSPYLLIVGLYYVILHLLGESPLRLAGWDTLHVHITQFNVWYRLVMSLAVIAYIAYQIWIIYRYEVSYRQWCEANYASTQEMEISWLRFYGLGVALITLAFFWVLLDGRTYCYVIHNITVQAFFCFTFYYGISHENPYSENFFRHTMDEEKARSEEIEEVPLLSVREDDAEQEKSMNEETFQARQSEYTAKVQQWMEEKRPYLRKDFKLLDVAEVLPLNRTYLSQIFNDGWGTSFSSVVRDYRIRYAEELLEQHQELTINQIALQCGFTSPSALHRAFTQCHDRITPKQYREIDK